MTDRPFIPWPNAVLRSPAAPVGAITDEVRALWDEMIAAMEAMPGVGLAAPQLGIGLQLAVVDASRGARPGGADGQSGGAACQRRAARA